MFIPRPERGSARAGPSNGATRHLSTRRTWCLGTGGERGEGSKISRSLRGLHFVEPDCDADTAVERTVLVFRVARGRRGAFAFRCGHESPPFGCEGSGTRKRRLRWFLVVVKRQGRECGTELRRSQVAGSGDGTVEESRLLGMCRRILAHGFRSLIGFTLTLFA